MAKSYRTVADWDGTSPFMWLFGFAGTAKANMVDRLYRLFQPGHFASYNLPPGITALTKALMSYEVLTSVNAGSTSVDIPSFATLGHTWDAAAPINLRFRVQQRGDGLVFVNPAAASGVTIDYMQLAPETMPKGSIITFSTVGVNQWVAS